MATHTGPSFALATSQPAKFDLYITGRDINNRSLIGKATLDLEAETLVGNVCDAPAFSVGELGTFDENGVSYPWIVDSGDSLYMYYVGWMPTVLTPFQNHTGLASTASGQDNWTRVSRAPILERTNAEPFSSGSCCVIKEGDLWRMYYTSFERWGSGPDDHKHYYVIKYAESPDGVNWKREGRVCIAPIDDSEYAIGKPSVIFQDGLYHMWFVHRGPRYRIGYAYSKDGLEWTRRDDLSGISVSDTGWDSEEVCYPHVFTVKDRAYMLYCGNNYGQAGLGLARLQLS